MDWEKVITSLRLQSRAAARAVHNLRERGGEPEHDKMIERHRINANFCDALATALEEGMPKGASSG